MKPNSRNFFRKCEKKLIKLFTIPPLSEWWRPHFKVVNKDILTCTTSLSTNCSYQLYGWAPVKVSEQPVHCRWVPMRRQQRLWRQHWRARLSWVVWQSSFFLLVFFQWLSPTIQDGCCITVTQKVLIHRSSSLATVRADKSLILNEILSSPSELFIINKKLSVYPVNSGKKKCYLWHSFKLQSALWVFLWEVWEGYNSPHHHTFISYHRWKSLVDSLLLTDKTSCSEGEVQCDNFICIEEAWVCDGDDDCQDGFDERNCGRLLMMRQSFVSAVSSWPVLFPLQCQWHVRCHLWLCLRSSVLSSMRCFMIV